MGRQLAKTLGCGSRGKIKQENCWEENDQGGDREEGFPVESTDRQLHGKNDEIFFFAMCVCMCACVRSHLITVTFTVFALYIGILYMLFHLFSCLSSLRSWM